MPDAISLEATLPPEVLELVARRAARIVLAQQATAVMLRGDVVERLAGHLEERE